MPIDREPVPADSGALRGALCVECEHLNPPGELICRECGAELYVVCRSRGHRNERIYTQCGKCRRPLGRSRWRVWMKRLFGRSHSCWMGLAGLLHLNFSGVSGVSEAVMELILRIG